MLDWATGPFAPNDIVTAFAHTGWTDCTRGPPLIARRRPLLACAALLLLASPSQAQDIKPPIRGLVSMGAYKFVWMGGDPVNTLAPLNAKPGIFGGLVVIATWSQLQPTPNSVIGNNNPIDHALGLVRAYNAQNPQKPLGVRLRVWGGFEAPEWAKHIGGPPIQTVHRNKPRTVGRFWSPAYRQAWNRLQEQLAARFDRRPLIQEVSVTSCMSFTAEPFFVPMDDTVLPQLEAAGFNEANHKRCLKNAVSDYAPWQHSRLVLAVNPLRSQPLPAPDDPGFTMRVMHSCREAIGARCVFDNHDLNAKLTPSLIPIYNYIKHLGPEIVFQTANATPKNFDGTIRLGALTYGASAIELYQDIAGKGFPVVPNTQLMKWANLIEKNPAEPAR